MEGAVTRVAVSPVGDFVAVAFVNGAVWMYHTDFPTRPVVLQGPGPGVSWLGFNTTPGAPLGATAHALRVVAVRSDRTVALYAVTTTELNVVADERGGRWTLSQDECERVFAGLSGMGPCDESGFWGTVKQTVTSALPGR
jgi:hypothetical protein